MRIRILISYRHESGLFRPWVVSANFCGGSFRPKKASRFGPGSFQPNFNRDRERIGIGVGGVGC